MPAHTPPDPPLMGLSARERMEAVQQSKKAVVRHAIISAAVALFLIGFNVAFTRGFLWFPWPVAALMVFWFYHLHKHLERTKGANQGFNAWLDDGSNVLGDARLPVAGSGQEKMPGVEPGPDHRQATLDFGKAKQRRDREWLE